MTGPRIPKGKAKAKEADIVTQLGTPAEPEKAEKPESRRAGVHRRWQAHRLQRDAGAGGRG